MESRSSYEFIPLESHGIMCVVFRGEPTLRDLGEAFAAFREHPVYHAEIDELLDFSRASMRRMKPSDAELIRLFLSEQKDRFETMQAAVVDADLDYGFYRMFELRSEDTVPQDRHVFRSMEDALEWLRPGQGPELLTQFREAMGERL